ncbi:nucleotidyltransferase [Allorhizocola rhizosphaerae]|uniref:nucleotidyltransferase n=1 Tax=Allorhizocola rhizosphaerae TaxID=1872709 RepID=UPI000E3B6E48|nr:nucleotidyltransferase [Allorhizocola rhizosphaerae]
MTEGYAEQLLLTLKRAASVLKAKGVPFALAGSYAAWAHGGHTSEHDVDFLIKHEDLEEITTALGEAGFRIEQPPEDWLIKAYDGEQLVDLIYRPIEIPVTDQTLADASVMNVGPISIPVLSATQLMVHKLLTFDQHNCDFARGLPLARSLREKIDWGRVQQDTEKSPYAAAFLVLVEKLGLAPAEQLRGGDGGQATTTTA